MKALPAVIPAASRPLEQRGRWGWRARGFVLSYWNETGTEKEAILGALMRACAAERYPVAMDAGWEDLDIDIAGGPAGGARVLIVGENHGADKRLLRVRAALRLSGLARGVIGAFGVLALASLVCRAPTGAAVFAVLAAVSGGLALWQLGLFARRLHGMIERAAGEAELVPVAPLPRAPLPDGPARTA